jgi:predicted HTH transcriptional regulator
MFQNRIDWTSPGELVEGVTIQEILHQQKARNPTLLRLLFQRSFVERIGQGLDTVFDECARAGLPAPSMRQAFGAFTISVTGHELVGTGVNRSQLNETQIDIINLLQSARNRSFNVADIVNHFGSALKRPRSKRAVQEDLKALVEAGILERIGHSVASAYILRDEHDRTG